VRFDLSVCPQSQLRRAIDIARREDEQAVVQRILPQARMPDDVTAAAEALARRLVTQVRAERSGASGVDALMREFSLSSQEGIALMCLAEALLRIPDRETADRLIRDKIGRGDWKAHLGNSPSLFVNAAAWGLLITGKLVSTSSEKGLSAALTRLIAKRGEPVIRMGVDLAMRLLGKQFVTGETIDEALRNSAEREARGYLFSYDMLGEAAVTNGDARRYLHTYEQAIHAIGAASRGRGIYGGNGISVKLSALHPRYTRAKHARVMTELLPRLKGLLLLAKQYDIGMSMDAEESDRLEISLDLLEALAFDPDLAGWNGIGFVVQSYLKRCPFVIDALIDLARRSNHRLMVRLVKGAYWDAEIKRAQVDGQAGYPVFTRKVYTDACFIACAKKLLSAPDIIYPQFATHNAYSLAAVYQLGGKTEYEFQCLHGMGETLYDQVVGPDKLDRRCRIYAPVGTHETLLAYLVRRLLENGANSSFVNQLVDPAVSIDQLVADHVREAAKLDGLPHERIPLPRDLYGAARRNSRSIDLFSDRELADLQSRLVDSERMNFAAGPLLGNGVPWTGDSDPVRNPADHDDIVGTVVEASTADVSAALAIAETVAPRWAATPPAERARCLEHAAELLEDQMPLLIGLAVREAGKSIANAVGEVREAVDFCRYYAAQIRAEFRNDVHRPLGPVASISPWNFPLAIFAGQLSAALAAGNPVIAKPAEQTPLIAAAAVQLFHQAGVPRDVLQLLPGGGEVGAAVVADTRVKGVIFTGSTEVAEIINRALAERGEDIPLIAETGGQNAMIVDSSSLPEQVVADVISSAFDSAGQRCSALRVLYLQEEIADRTIEMLKGAMDELAVGNPAKLATDVGPVIDPEAQAALLAHIDAMMQRRAKSHYQAKLTDGARGTMVVPTMFEIDGIRELSREVFGPVLHVVRYPVAELPRVMEDINSTGYGLTHGVHSRIDETVEQDIRDIEAGNVYVNRNIIGAVVGVQPFGGHGKSGTGPKAGGPLYLHRLVRTEREPSLTGEAVPASFAALDALQAAFVEIGELNADQRTLLLARLSGYRSRSPLCLELRLPGPTGERNWLRFLPRGTIGCQAQNLQQLIEQLAAAWATGNRALLPDTDVGRRLLRSIDHPDVAFARDLGDADIDALLFAGEDAEGAGLRRRLAARDGPLVPFIREREGGGYDLYRLVVEQTVSINTTAAGGNASLMSLLG
jgi:RHH-type transcriptional regulator, proline utilization regulon repressor / proline dehydrogenase / delta 1-pyrroline-5-carboxylate dehydrogenase